VILCIAVMQFYSHQSASYWRVMQRKAASGNQTTHCTQAKAGLATFYGIGYVCVRSCHNRWGCTTAALVSSELPIVPPPPCPLIDNIWAVLFVWRKRGDYQNCPVLYCVLKLCTV